MPEGHVIHRLAADQSRLLVGDRLIVESPQGRFENEARRLTGTRLESIEAHGKHLFYHFESNRIVHVHLGLYGKYRHFENPPAPPRGAVRLRVIGNRNGFDLNGPNRCRLITPGEQRQLRQRLGEDPLRPDADFAKVWEKIGNSRSPIGTVLLNQSIIAGIGNIYRSEILFLHGINPQTPANELDVDQFRSMWETTRDLMALGRDLRQIVTRRPTGQAGRQKLPAKERFNIYKRPSCPDCGAAIYYWSLANRTVYACEVCQPFPLRPKSSKS